MKTIWTENESKMIEGLKRHLNNPICVPVSFSNASIAQKRLRSGKNKKDLWNLWNQNEAFWEAVPQGFMPKFCWQMELAQCVVFLATKRIADLNSCSFSRTYDFLFDEKRRYRYEHAVPHLNETFPGYQLKDAIQKNNTAKIMFYLDTAPRREVKLRNVYHALLNRRNLEAAWKLHETYGGLDQFGMEVLYEFLISAGRSNVPDAFNKFVLPHFCGEDFWEKLHRNGSLEKSILSALDAGASPELFVMGKRQYFLELTLRKYLDFLLEIEPELTSFLSTVPNHTKWGMNRLDLTKLKSDLNAAKMFREREARQNLQTK